jgi:hypothetical protein
VIVFILQRLVSAQFSKLADEFEAVNNEAIELWGVIESQGRELRSYPNLSELIKVAHSGYANAAHYGSYAIGLTYWPRPNDYVWLRVSFRELRKMQKWRKSGTLRRMLSLACAEVAGG